MGWCRPAASLPLVPELTQRLGTSANISGYEGNKGAFLMLPWFNPSIELRASRLTTGAFSA